MLLVKLEGGADSKYILGRGGRGIPTGSPLIFADLETDVVEKLNAGKRRKVPHWREFHWVFCVDSLEIFEESGVKRGHRHEVRALYENDVSRFQINCRIQTTALVFSPSHCDPLHYFIKQPPSSRSRGAPGRRYRLWLHGSVKAWFEWMESWLKAVSWVAVLGIARELIGCGQVALCGHGTEAILS
mmetsp:Transcript_50814/g.99933  ORF Transcript_50814/g.99933 Transcript_50814/m.99933 type:complete len:186 (-) Transcript_50814:283-840(-)